MKKSARALVLFFATFLLTGQTAAAASVTTSPPPAEPANNVLLTSIAGNELLDDAEIYNQSTAPVNLAGWQLIFSVHFAGAAACSDQPFQVSLPSGWLLPKSYFTITRGNGQASDQEAFFDISDNDLLAGCGTTAKLASLTLRDSSGTNVQTVIIPAPATLPVQHFQRDNSPNSTRTLTGDFAKDYVPIPVKDFDNAQVPLFFSDPLYEPPDDSDGLQILEILPHARDCAPDDNASPDCNDYVKLYNSTSQPVNLSQYRLRIGAKGQSTSVTNTFDFGQTLAPGQYFTLATRDDGQTLSIPDAGDFVWLEDVEGVRTYEPVVQYPDAGSTTKIGWAWAFDGTTWRWTPTPQPFGANTFPAVTSDLLAAAAITPTLKPCAVGQFRNPTTNRCKAIEVSASALVPCQSGQIRNPATNRCRSTLASSISLQPCNANQERNPATNRCKSITASTHTLQPCQPGWTRNLQTNRCRKGSVLGDATTKVQDVKSPTVASSARWLLAGCAVFAALAYGLYEWRQELGQRLAQPKKLVSGIIKLKK